MSSQNTQASIVAAFESHSNAHSGRRSAAVVSAAYAPQAGHTESERLRARRARFDRPTIRVAVLTPERGPRILQRTSTLLRDNPRTAGCVLGEVSGADIRGGALDHHDVLYAPGGSVFQQQTDLGPEGRAIMAQWVAGGGGYVHADGPSIPWSRKQPRPVPAPHVHHQPLSSTRAHSTIDPSLPHHTCMHDSTTDCDNHGRYVGVCAGALLAGQDGFDGAVHGTGIVGGATAWSGWDPADGKWSATVVLTPDGRSVVGGPEARPPSTAGNPTPSTPSATGTTPDPAHHEDGERYCSPCGSTTTTDAADGDDDREVSVVLTGGCWYTPGAVCHRLLGLNIEPFVPLATFVRIEKKGAEGGGSVVPSAAYGTAVPAVAGNFGEGRVVVWGPHPEAAASDPHARGWLGESIYWASRKGVAID